MTASRQSQRHVAEKLVRDIGLLIVSKIGVTTPNTGGAALAPVLHSPLTPRLLMRSSTPFVSYRRTLAVARTLLVMLTAAAHAQSMPSEVLLNRSAPIAAPARESAQHFGTMDWKGGEFIDGAAALLGRTAAPIEAQLESGSTASGWIQETGINGERALFGRVAQAGLRDQGGE